MIDYVFRYDPTHPDTRPALDEANEAREALIAGNRVFTDWMASCREAGEATKGAKFIIPCTGEITFMGPGQAYPTQRPFAVVLGCADARVPTEMLFGQGFNDLFVVRVAGNVIGDSVQGSIDLAIQALAVSVRVLVVLGHTNCSAVKGAVDAYLDPARFWSNVKSPHVRQLYQHIFVAVRESDNALREIWGPNAPSQTGYRETLIEMAVCLNAAHSAFALRQQVELANKHDIHVLFGVYDIRTHQVCMPIPPVDRTSPENTNLEPAPTTPRQFSELAAIMAAEARRFWSS